MVYRRLEAFLRAISITPGSLWKRRRTVSSLSFQSSASSFTVKCRSNAGETAEPPAATPDCLFFACVFIFPRPVLEIAHIGFAFEPIFDGLLQVLPDVGHGIPFNFLQKQLFGNTPAGTMDTLSARRVIQTVSTSLARYAAAIERRGFVWLIATSSFGSLRPGSRSMPTYR